jgi:hypothetical protein
LKKIRRWAVTWSCTKCVWAASIFFQEKDGWGLRADNEKRNAAALFVIVCIFRTLADSMSSRFSIK